MADVRHSALAAAILALFAVRAEAAANMCKNPADLDPTDGYCPNLVNREIERKLPGGSFDTVTCALLCGSTAAAARQHMEGYPFCCGGTGAGMDKLLCFNSNGTCDATETNTHANTGSGPGSGSGSRPPICKSNVDLVDNTGEVQAELLARASCDTRAAAASCAEFNAGDRKQSFYEHTTFGTVCCGARDRVKCLDSSSMCKLAADYKPFYSKSEWDGKNCAFWDGFLLSRFNGTSVNWADITCEQIAGAKYNNDLIDLSTEEMSEVLAMFADCCGGQAKTKCGAGSILTPAWPLALMIAVLQVSVLSL